MLVSARWKFGDKIIGHTCFCKVSTSLVDISGQWSFITRSTLIDLAVLPPTCFSEVEISPPEAESSMPNRYDIHMS